MNSPVYSIVKVYKDLMGTQDKVHWVNTTWNRAIIPRNRFIMWLAYHDRLKTKQQLINMGIVDDDKCPIYDTKT